MTALNWAGATVSLAVAIGWMIRSILRQAQSPDERWTALWAYASPLPGAAILGIGPLGLSPTLLWIPALVYAEILAVTRCRPLLLLRFLIDRFDTPDARRAEAWTLGAVTATILVGLPVLEALAH